MHAHPNRQEHPTNGATRTRAVPPIDPALLDRGADQQAEPRRSQEVIAKAFLAVFAGQVLAVKHQQLTLPVEVRISVHPGTTLVYYRLCSCGFVSRPFGASYGADVSSCPLQDAERLRDAHLKTIHAERVVQALLQLSIGG